MGHDLTLTQVLEPYGPATALVLTDEEVERRGGGKRAAVRVTIGGRSARLRLAVMGGTNVVGLSKASRAELGVEIGDEVTARIGLDDAPREVEVPAELAEVLDGDSEAAAAYARLSFSHRKEFATWVGGAKQAATRTRRAATAVEMLHEGRTR